MVSLHEAKTGEHSNSLLRQVTLWGLQQADC